MCILEWGGGAPSRAEIFPAWAGGCLGRSVLRPFVRSLVRHEIMVSKRPMKPLVCARFRAWGGKKVVFIWVAKTKAKWSKSGSIFTFCGFLSRNVTFFALKTWLTFNFDDKCGKWPNFDAKTSYTCQESCPERRCPSPDRKRVAQRRRFAISARKSGLHVVGEFATQKHKKINFSAILSFPLTKRYLFCFKHKLRTRPGWQVPEMVKFWTENVVHVWKSCIGFVFHFLHELLVKSLRDSLEIFEVNSEGFLSIEMKTIFIIFD